MDDYLKIIWKEIVKQCRKYMEEDQTLVLYTDAEELFYRNFKYFHSFIMKKFMILGEDKLDRHKIAAIIMCAILESNIVGISKEERDKSDDSIFLVNEKISVDVGLCEMQRLLKKEFEGGKFPYDAIFEEILLPVPLSCNREYTEVICRDLYFSKMYYTLNPISLANFLFLLEAYTFQVYQIPIDEEKKMQIEKDRALESAQKELEAIEHKINIFAKKKEQEYIDLCNRKEELGKMVQSLRELNNIE